MEEVVKIIKTNRPKISESSIKAYCSNLRNIFYKAHIKSTPFDLAWFSKTENIIDTLKDTNPNTRKTNYASVLAVYPNNDKIKELMLEDQRVINKKVSTHEKNDKQEDNWIEYDEVKQKVDDYLKKNKSLLTSKNDLDATEFKKIQLGLILALTTGVFDGLPPRRNMDWNCMMFRGYNKDTDNYITKTSFVFNKYKTAKTGGTEEIPIPKELKPIINNFLRHRKKYDGNYLLYKIGAERTTYEGNEFGKLLNSFFDKNIGTSMLRHIYLSHSIPLKKIEEDAKRMGHSVKEAFNYVKL